MAGQAAFDEVQARLRILGNPKRAEHSKRFFKTSPGEYGEGDIRARRLSSAAALLYGF